MLHVVIVDVNDSTFTTQQTWQRNLTSVTTDPNLPLHVRMKELAKEFENGEENYNIDITTSSTTVEDNREPRLGDGCYHIFIDAGANIGIHGRFLLEPEKYPLSSSSVALFAEEYGPSPRRNEDYCVFEIEANPRHWDRLLTIARAYDNVGWKYHLIQAAASDREDYLTFFHQGGNEVAWSEWGFSAASDQRNQRSHVKPDEKDEGSMEVVPAIRLSEWIRYHILERKIPSVPPSSSKNNVFNNDLLKPPVLGMKMDIEGSEYSVLPDLIHTGVFCKFDFVFGEFHSRYAPITPLEGHRISLETVAELDYYAGALMKVMRASRNCKARFFQSDDETYLHDGQPLPDPFH